MSIYVPHPKPKNISFQAPRREVSDWFLLTECKSDWVGSPGDAAVAYNLATGGAWKGGLMKRETSTMVRCLRPTIPLPTDCHGCARAHKPEPKLFFRWRKERVRHGWVGDDSWVNKCGRY